MGEVERFAVTVLDLGEGRTAVRVQGELDLATSAELEAALESAPTSGRVLLDLSECGFLDSSAIRVVAIQAERLETHGSGLSLVAPDPSVRRVLEIAGLDQRVVVHSTLGDAELEAG